MDITSTTTIIVTGASSGIGRATAELLGRFHVPVILASRNVPALEELHSSLPDSMVVETDMTDASSIHHLIASVIEKYGHIDALINNAGQGFHTPVEAIDPDDLRAIFELNVLGPLIAMQAVLPHMRNAHRGSIVNISSGTTRMIPDGFGGYAASKAALNMLSQAAREELKKDGITVSLIYPFLTKTHFHENLLRNDSIRTREPGFVAQGHSPEFVARYIVHALLTGETEIVLTPGTPDALLPHMWTTSPV
ncbi:MAG: SDR family NAD(P)-dependent oxidoreductase [Candidatus Dormibacteria bacterium]